MDEPEPGIDELKAELRRLLWHAIETGQTETMAPGLQQQILAVRVKLCEALYRIGESEDEIADVLEVRQEDVETLLRLGDVID
ncbi:MAG TPA: hypothetical protein VMF30_15690 [Pirellulales bacterium]|nr:hypothetical protein [Pirellulales bacterium]